MLNMQNFCILELLTEIPTFLLSEPIIYIIGILLFGYVVSIVFKLLKGGY